MELWSFTVFFLLAVNFNAVYGDNLKSCQAYKEAGYNANDQYVIDADGESGILSPFTVSCDMSDSAAVTTIHHDYEVRTLVQGYDESGSYSLAITYGSVSTDQILAVIADAGDCKQWIQYDCFHSALNLESSVPNAWWEDYSSARHYYWGNSDNTPGYCECGLADTCTDVSESVSPGLKCNCDHNDAQWRSDQGYLTNKNVLPVTKLRFGDTGDDSEEGYHTLGPLMCTGSIPTTSPPLTAASVDWVNTSTGIATVSVVSILVVAILIGLICICFRHTVIGCCKECGTGCRNCCWAFGSGCRGCCDQCGLNCRGCLDNCCTAAPPPPRKPIEKRWDKPRQKNNEIIMAPTKELQTHDQSAERGRVALVPSSKNYSERKPPVNRVNPSALVEGHDVEANRDFVIEPRTGKRKWAQTVDTIGVLNNWRRGSRPHNAVYNTNTNELPATPVVNNA